MKQFKIYFSSIPDACIDALAGLTIVKKYSLTTVYRFMKNEMTYLRMTNDMSCDCLHSQVMPVIEHHSFCFAVGFMLDKFSQFLNFIFIFIFWQICIGR